MVDIEKILCQLSLEEKAKLCAGHDFWHTEAIERLQIPAIMMCDGPHGLRKQIGKVDHLGVNKSVEAVCFPTASALASSFDRDLLFLLGEALGDECRAEDIGMLLGPGLNIKRSPLCGRNFEYFSEDPYLTGELGSAYIKGLQGKGIAACPKHYAANNQETHRMNGDSRLDERTLHEIYLPAFEKVVKDGKTRSIMCSYNKVNGTYASENKELLTDILRGKWGFDGFVVTDWAAVKDRVTGLLAGLDLEMPGGPNAKTQKILEAVSDGRLDIDVLNKAVSNILKFVFDCPAARRPNSTFSRENHHLLSGKIAQECAVLMKNEGNLLPLNPKNKIAFIGEFAAAPRYQGAGSSFINVPHAVSAVEAVAGLPICYAKGYRADREDLDQTLLDEAVALAKNSDAAVLFVGLTASYETEGLDRKTLAMPENQNKLIRAVLAVQPNTAVVLHGGAPFELNWHHNAPAILNMHLSGDHAGTATAALLFGDVNPCGKLAETWPLKLADTSSYLNFPGSRGVVNYNEGVFVGYRYYDKKELDIQYPFGHGLSYTTFHYRALQLDKREINEDELLSVSCVVKNTGNRTGKEVVQLYVRSAESEVPRPVRELRDFQKIELKPGAEKIVCFTLNRHAFAYYEPLVHDWYVESGSYAVEIGASSRDIRLEMSVQVNGSAELPLTLSEHSTLSELMQSERGKQVAAAMIAGATAAIGQDTKSVGLSSGKTIESMLFDVPFSALVSLGLLSEEQLYGIMATLQNM